MNLIFDCDDTLYDRSWPFKMAVKDLLPERDVDIEEFYKTYMAIGETYFPLLATGKITTDESGELRFKDSAPLFGYEVTDELAVNFQQRYKYYQGEIQLDENFKEYLMHCDHLCAVLTNGENTHQRRKVKALGLYDFIDEKHVYTSGEIGYAKPDIRIFTYVLEQWGGEPSDWFYIGDNYEVDMEGAKKAGLRTIHFNRHHNMSGPCSDYEVFTEKELIELLKTL